MIDKKENLQKEWDKISPTQIIRLEQIKETRSMGQHRLYFKWLNDLNGQLAEKGIFISNNDLHEGLRDKLIKGTYEINTLTGRRLVKRRSTTQLKKGEFSQYLKDIEHYLRQTFEISHPKPTDLFYNN